MSRLVGAAKPVIETDKPAAEPRAPMHCPPPPPLASPAVRRRLGLTAGRAPRLRIGGPFLRPAVVVGWS